MSQLKQNKCYVHAVQMLTRREYSKLELRKILQSKNFNDKDIDDSINLLVTQKYQSDERFSANLIHMRFNQGKGPVRISMELKKLGIDAVDLSVFDWGQLAKDIRQKKFGTKLPASYKEQAKQKRFLQYRGFTLEQINQVF